MTTSQVHAKSKYYYALDNAREKKLEPKNGGFIQIIRSSSADAAIFVAVDDGFSDEDYIELKRGDSLKVDGGFERIYVRNAAQAGEWVEMLVTGSEDEFSVELAPRGEVNSISQPVVTKGGNTLAHSQVSVVSAAAAVLGIAAAAATTEWIIKNDSGAAGTLYIVDSVAGTSATGFPLLAGEAVSMQVTDDVYLYAAGGNADARILKGSKV